MMGFDLDGEAAHVRLTMTNKNYALDVGRTLRYTRWLLDLLGVWPMVKKNPKKWEIHGSKILIATCLTLVAFILIPITLHMILMSKNSIEMIMIFGPIGYCLTALLKYWAIIFRRKIIKRCMHHVEFDWMWIETEKDHEIMTRNVNFGHGVTVMCAIFMYAGGFSYNMIMPLWRGNKINEFNETVKPLVYPGYDLFVDPQARPNYEIIFCMNCVSSAVMYTVATAACNLAATFVAHACGQIEIMMFRLENLFDKIDETSEILRKRVCFVVNSHARVLRLTSMIEMLLREICLVEVVTSTIIICLIEYYCVKTWNDSKFIVIVTYVILLVSVSFNVFVFCQIGESLKEQCYQIGKVAYMMDWYRLPDKTGLALIMILAMSNCPRKLTAGGMIELSIGTFGAIIKTSVAYLNMLRAMTD